MQEALFERNQRLDIRNRSCQELRKRSQRREDPDSQDVLQLVQCHKVHMPGRAGGQWTCHCQVELGIPGAQVVCKKCDLGLCPYTNKANANLFSTVRRQNLFQVRIYEVVQTGCVYNCVA
jgi:hypothetical protein